MTDRNRIAEALNGLAVARARNDNDAVQRFFAPGARYALAANHSLIAAMNDKEGEAETVVAELIATFRFHDVQVLDLVVDGNKAATRWRVRVSVEGGELVQTDLCEVWTFDDNGLITELHEFADTAQIVEMFRARR